MIRKEFPDLKWLKGRIQNNLNKDKHGKELSLHRPVWPTVILNATTQLVERPDIRGPLSLFTNISRESYAAVHGHRVKVEPSFYFLTNQEEHYSLEINSVTPVETFNIHFGEFFTDQVYASLTLPYTILLEREFEPQPHSIAFFNKLYRKDTFIEQIIQEIYSRYSQENPGSLWLEEQLTRLVIHLLGQHQNLLAELRRLPALKSTTRVEIYKRLAHAVDYLYTYYSQEITLDELSRTACLSKFHFLRLFKTAFGQTPHQFLINVRMEKARNLLKQTNLPVHDIALSLGFEDSSSFSRSFFKHIRCYPTFYRSQI